MCAFIGALSMPERRASTSSTPSIVMNIKRLIACREIAPTPTKIVGNAFSILAMLLLGRTIAAPDKNECPANRKVEISTWPDFKYDPIKKVDKTGHWVTDPKDCKLLEKSDHPREHFSQEPHTPAQC